MHFVTQVLAVCCSSSWYFAYTRSTRFQRMPINGTTKDQTAMVEQNGAKLVLVVGRGIPPNLSSRDRQWCVL